MRIFSSLWSLFWWNGENKWRYKYTLWNDQLIKFDNFYNWISDSDIFFCPIVVWSSPASWSVRLRLFLQLLILRLFLWSFGSSAFFDSPIMCYLSCSHSFCNRGWCLLPLHEKPTQASKLRKRKNTPVLALQYLWSSPHTSFCLIMDAFCFAQPVHKLFRIFSGF